MQQYLDRLESILSNLFAKYGRMKTIPGVLLSGGIDSSTVTHLVSRTFPEYRIFSMGTGRTKDREFVIRMTKYLNHGYHWVELTDDSIRYSLKTVSGLLEKANIPPTTMQLSLAVGYFLIFKAAHGMDVSTVFTGQGPDITFAGYHKYKTVSDVAAEIRKDLPLLEIDKRRDSAMAAYFGISLINPFLEQEMVDFAMEVPADFKIREGVEKYILRKYAEDRGLPREIVERPKKAFQYSTGLQNAVKNILK